MSMPKGYIEGLDGIPNPYCIEEILEKDVE
jgi:hypothetical protein